MATGEAGHVIVCTGPSSWYASLNQGRRMPSLPAGWSLFPCMPSPAAQLSHAASRLSMRPPWNNWSSCPPACFLSSVPVPQLSSWTTLYATAQALPASWMKWLHSETYYFLFVWLPSPTEFLGIGLPLEQLLKVGGKEITIYWVLTGLPGTVLSPVFMVFHLLCITFHE